jgi:protein-S-isoprenylcysteine O-methyltransferase Ste14
MHITYPANAFFLLGLLTQVIIRGYYARRTRHNQKTVRRVDALEKILLALVIPGSLVLPLLYLFSPLLNFADYHLPKFALWLGAILMIVSLWLFYRSHADLGQNWSVTLEVRQGHQLVTGGVYHYIRHPMYASIFLFCFAQGLLLENWLAGWYPLFAFCLMYFLRTPREEQLMLETFGEEYQDYMLCTGRILPRLGRSRSRRNGQ